LFLLFTGYILPAGTGPALKAEEELEALANGFGEDLPGKNRPNNPFIDFA
jgi:hypothetical protein